MDIAEAGIATKCLTATSTSDCAARLGGEFGTLEQFQICSGSLLTAASTIASPCAPRPAVSLLSGITRLTLPAQQSTAAKAPVGPGDPAGAGKATAPATPAAPSGACATCPDFLSVDINYRAIADVTFQTNCVSDLGSCVHDLSAELARFKSCAGFSLTACSIQQLVTLGTLGKDMYVGITSDTALESFLAGVSDTLPCSPCVKAGAKRLLSKDAEIRACASGQACTLTAELEWFNSCSGATLAWADFYSAPVPPDVPSVTTSTTTNSGADARVYGLIPMLLVALFFN